MAKASRNESALLEHEVDAWTCSNKKQQKAHRYWSNLKNSVIGSENITDGNERNRVTTSPEKDTNGNNAVHDDEGTRDSISDDGITLGNDVSKSFCLLYAYSIPSALYTDDSLSKIEVFWPLSQMVMCVPVLACSSTCLNVNHEREYLGAIIPWTVARM